MNFEFDGLAGDTTDVNPRCDQKNTGCAPGDYWTGPGSEDSEQRAYNCNWTHNMLGLDGYRAVRPGGLPSYVNAQRLATLRSAADRLVVACDSDRNYCANAMVSGTAVNAALANFKFQWNSTQPFKLIGRGYDATIANAVGSILGSMAPTACPVGYFTGLYGAPCKCFGSCRGSCRACMCGCSWCKARSQACQGGQPPKHTCAGLAGVSACDTRWQNDDYPPTEGPTDADIRCAGCWWVKTQLGLQGAGLQGAPTMNGITLRGRPVNVEGPAGIAARGLAAPPAQGLGAAGAGAVSPTTVGLVAAISAVGGAIAGAALGAEVGSAYGTPADRVRRAATGGVVGMMFGAFAGAAIVAPSVQSQGGA